MMTQQQAQTIASGHSPHLTAQVIKYDRHHVYAVLRFTNRNTYAAASICYTEGMGPSVSYSLRCERVHCDDLPGSVGRILSAAAEDLINARFWTEGSAANAR